MLIPSAYTADVIDIRVLFICRKWAEILSAEILFYISMEILLGENGQLGAFPDLLFEYFQIICPWKYYGAKTDLFNIGIL